MSHPYENYPLPPNVEKKYDFNTKKFFYIDHSNKSTTWEDPRPNFYAQQQAQQQRQFGFVNQNLIAPNIVRHPSPQPQRIPQQVTMPAQINQMNQRSRESSDSDAIEETNFNDLFELDEEFAFETAALQSKFPNATAAEIKSLLNKHDGNLDKSIKELQAEVDAANRKKEFETKVKIVSDSFPEFSKEFVSKLMKKHNLIVYKVRDELASTRSKRSDALRSLRMQFSDVKENIIKDIFEISNHDLNETSKKLKEMGFSRPSVTAAVSKSSSATQDKPSSTQSNKENNNTPRPEQTATTASNRSKSPSPVPPATVVKIEPPTKRTAAAKTSPVKRPVKTKATPPAKTPQRTKPEHTKRLSTLAKGANADLLNGPDTSLLSYSEHSLPLAVGPDPSLRRDPEARLHLDSRLQTLGPNPALCRGPNLELRNSANPQLLIGSV